MFKRLLKPGLLIAMMAGMLAGGLAPAAAQGTPVSAPTMACDGPARTAEEVAALKGSGPEQVISRIERAGAASEADVQAIGETAAGCVRLPAGAGHRSGGGLPERQPVIARDLFALSFEPSTEEAPLTEFLGIFAAWNLSDGRIAAVVGVDDSSQVIPVSTIVMVFVNIEGRWLIDDVGDQPVCAWRWARIMVRIPLRRPPASSPNSASEMLTTALTARVASEKAVTVSAGA